MARITRSRISVLDYEEIWQYIAKDDPHAADRLIATFEERLSLIAAMPAMGKGESDLAPQLRSFPVENYFLYYRESSHGIELVRVLHGARDISADYFSEN